MRRHINRFISIVAFCLSFYLNKYKQPCKNAECQNLADGSRCYKIKKSSGEEGKAYLFNKHNEVDIEKNGEYDLPKSRFLRIMLVGYRAAYMRSADMITMGLVTTLVALLIPAGNFYLWYRVELLILEEKETNIQIDEIFYYAGGFSGIIFLIILAFALHFLGILSRTTNKILALLRRGI